MDATVRVKRVISIASDGGTFRFHVEIESHGANRQVEVSAEQLLDFDRFQTAVLEQTGRLVMAPCEPGLQGPEHYRRHRRNWCDELQRATWDGPQQSTLTPPKKSSTKSVVPPPKMRDAAGNSPFRLG